MARTPIHPGEHLAEELSELGISAAELARQVDVPVNRITGIINGQRGVTADTALVTMTVGGNDIAYTATTLVCEQNPACMTTVSQTSIDSLVVALPGRLEQLVADLRARAPHATIVLVSYPQVIPPEGAQCAKLLWITTRI